MTKKNRVQDVHIATGGHVLAQNVDRHKAAVVRVPPHKTTGNLPAPEQPTGFAKASPSFKDVPRQDETDPEKQKKTLAENTLESKEKQDDKK
jgi:hypothetical protein